MHNISKNVCRWRTTASHVFALHLPDNRRAFIDRHPDSEKISQCCATKASSSEPQASHADRLAVCGFNLLGPGVCRGARFFSFGASPPERCAPRLRSGPKAFEPDGNGRDWDGSASFILAPFGADLLVSKPVLGGTAAGRGPLLFCRCARPISWGKFAVRYCALRAPL